MSIGIEVEFKLGQTLLNKVMTELIDLLPSQDDDVVKNAIGEHITKLQVISGITKDMFLDTP